MIDTTNKNKILISIVFILTHSIYTYAAKKVVWWYYFTVIIIVLSSQSQSYRTDFKVKLNEIKK